ncbi:hypothetical protein KC363_g29 [Hortaea werneckii]|nr:hypothetical protein KC363_g29 [Hortaea werneckii]
MFTVAPCILLTTLTTAPIRLPLRILCCMRPQGTGRSELEHPPQLSAAADLILLPSASSRNRYLYARLRESHCIINNPQGHGAKSTVAPSIFNASGGFRPTASRRRNSTF